MEIIIKDDLGNVLSLNDTESCAVLTSNNGSLRPLLQPCLGCLKVFLKLDDTYKKILGTAGLNPSKYCPECVASGRDKKSSLVDAIVLAMDRQSSNDRETSEDDKDLPN